MSICYSQESIRKRAESVVEAVSSSVGERTVLSWMGSISSTSHAGQAAFWMRSRDALERSVLHLLRSHIVSVEARFPGAGEICASVGSKAFVSWINRARSGESQADIKESHDRAVMLLEKTLSGRRRLHAEDVPSLLAGVPDEISAEIQQILVSAPLSSTISVRPSRSSATQTAVSSGFSIPVAVDPRVQSSKTIVNPRVVLYDGNIDSVGQIHRVLSDSAETRSSYLVICRGFADDVAQTVSVNAARGTVSVILVSSRLDDLTIGALEDIAAYTGSWIISSHSGESISSAFERILPCEGRFWVEGASLRSSSSPHAGLDAHIDRLKRDSVAGDQTVLEFLERRILGLSSSRIEVFVGESDQRQIPGLMETVDSRMRSLAASFTRGVEHGIVTPNEMDPQIRGIIVESVPDMLRTSGSAAAGAIAGIKFARDLCTIGHAVV